MPSGAFRHRGVVHAGAHQRRHQHRKHQRHRIRHHQAHKPFGDGTTGVIKPRQALRGEAGGSQIPPQHQEHLYRHAAVVRQPGHECRGQGLGDVRHRPIKSQVVPDDGRACEPLDHVDQGRAGRGGGHGAQEKINPRANTPGETRYCALSVGFLQRASLAGGPTVAHPRLPCLHAFDELAGAPPRRWSSRAPT